MRETKNYIVEPYWTPVRGLRRYRAVRKSDKKTARLSNYDAIWLMAHHKTDAMIDNSLSLEVFG